MKNVMGLAALVLVGACSSDADPCTPGNACVYAGTGAPGYNNQSPNADRRDSKLYYPYDMTFGPDGRGYIVDWNNHLIRRVEKDDSLRIIMGTDYEGDGSPGETDRLPTCNPEGAIGTNVALNHPTDAKFGPDGKLYVAAWHNNKIRVIDTETDMVTSLAGNSYGFKGDGGPGCDAIFSQPKSVLFGDDGTLYTIDQRNVRIRAFATDATRTITTFAGMGKAGNTGDGGPATAAMFGFDTKPTPDPTGALAIKGNFMYVADSINNRIRRIDMTTGIVDCIAGRQDDPSPGYSGDGGPALAAKFNWPMDLEWGSDGRLYIADSNNSVIRAIDLDTGIIETVAGTGTVCDVTTSKCPLGTALETPLNLPQGIAFDATGNLYIADTHNHRILKVTK